MPTDFTKFPFPGIGNAQAPSVTEAITWGPSDSGFIVVTIQTDAPDKFVEAVREFAKTLRSDAPSNGFIEVLAFRHLLREEMGGAMPFDQAICETMLKDADRHLQKDPDRFPALKAALKVAEGANPGADWILLLEYKDLERAKSAVNAFASGQSGFSFLTQNSTTHSLNFFKNTKRYAHVVRDPDVIHFFNLFPGPGDPEGLWPQWQAALPWFFEVGEFRSSFPLVALDANQPYIVVNYAHIDSVKHFFLGAFYDPTYLETIKRCYSDHGFTLPLPFFCKIVPV